MAVRVLDIERSIRAAEALQSDPEALALLTAIGRRKASKSAEMARFSELCDRWDNLYYPNDFTTGGADHWAEFAKQGRAHVSVNAYPVYVDVPSSLQAEEPIENMVSPKDDETIRTVTAAVERLYFAWKEDVDFEMYGHQACVVKSLYGRTAGKVWFDEEEGRPAISVVDQPRNLYMGWSASNYRKLDWALYVYRISPETAHEQYGLIVDGLFDSETRQVEPFFRSTQDLTGVSRSWLSEDLMMAEVFDYWYKKPKDGATTTIGKPVAYETWNAIFIGNVMVKNEAHPEYDGRMPYVPLFNSYLPGVPDGKPEFYDIEQLLREKDERLSAGAQMISRTVSGQFWQLVGPEAPYTVPAGVKPKPDEVIGPGPNNRIEKIEPWMPEFQLEQFLTRLDRELSDVSGLNDLLRGLSPAAILSSGKAIAALVANYETRIKLKRKLYYRWRKDMWDLARVVWAAKVPEVAAPLRLIRRIEVFPPSLTPRDDLETSTLATNLFQSKLWSQARAMDRVQVDDPETEQNIIRQERTDATMFPADVQVMAQLLVLLRSQGVQPQQDVASMAGGQAAALASVRALNPSASGQTSLNAPGEQPMGPPEAQPANTPGGAALVGAPPTPPEAGPPGAGGKTVMQSAIKGGEVTNRVLSSTPVQGG